MRSTSPSLAGATEGAPFAMPPANLHRRKETEGGMLDEQSKQKMKELCDRIADEQDHHRFSSLVAELNRLLDDCYPAPAINSKKERL
jgi:hypothetical protein